MLIDPCGRPVESIRISVTQRCNLNCFYCHQEGEAPAKGIEMAPEEIQRITRIAASLGIAKVKLTGGEPLLRKGILGIVQRIRDTPGIKEVSMTTNGVLLARYAHHLREAGLTRINVSLDSLKPDKFQKITNVDALEDVVSGIMEAVKAHLYPIKINMVLLKDINEDEIAGMIEFTTKNSLILQIIEIESPDESKVYERYHVELDGVEDYLKNIAEKVTVRRMHHRRIYHLYNGSSVEIVKPMHNTEFCQYCNRIRLTSNGKLKPCLFRNDNLVDILGPIRKSASDETLKHLFLEAVKQRDPYFT